jgi:hypothetical protein
MAMSWLLERRNDQIHTQACPDAEFAVVSATGRD